MAGGREGGRTRTCFYVFARVHDNIVMEELCGNETAISVAAPIWPNSAPGPYFKVEESEHMTIYSTFV
jgi:hypothetical protein